MFACTDLTGNLIVGVLTYLQSSFSFPTFFASGSSGWSIVFSFGKKAELGAGKSAVSIVARDIGRSIGGETWARKILGASVVESVRPC